MVGWFGYRGSVVGLAATGRLCIVGAAGCHARPSKTQLDTLGGRVRQQPGHARLAALPFSGQEAQPLPL